MKSYKEEANERLKLEEELIRIQEQENLRRQLEEENLKRKLDEELIRIQEQENEKQIFEKGIRQIQEEEAQKLKLDQVQIKVQEEGAKKLQLEEGELSSSQDEGEKKTRTDKDEKQQLQQKLPREDENLTNRKKNNLQKTIKKINDENKTITIEVEKIVLNQKQKDQLLNDNVVNKHFTVDNNNNHADESSTNNHELILSTPDYSSKFNKKINDDNHNKNNRKKVNNDLEPTDAFLNDILQSQIEAKLQNEKEEEERKLIQQQKIKEKLSKDIEQKRLTNEKQEIEKEEAKLKQQSLENERRDKENEEEKIRKQKKESSEQERLKQSTAFQTEVEKEEEKNRKRQKILAQELTKRKKQLEELEQNDKKKLNLNEERPTQVIPIESTKKKLRKSSITIEKLVNINNNKQIDKQNNQSSNLMEVNGESLKSIGDYFKVPKIICSSSVPTPSPLATISSLNKIEKYPNLIKKKATTPTGLTKMNLYDDKNILNSKASPTIKELTLMKVS
jgi:hypothetical protein